MTFSAVLDSVLTFYRPLVTLPAILGSALTFYKPLVTFSAVLGSVMTFYRPLVTLQAALRTVSTFYRPLVTFLAILESVPLLPSPCTQTLQWISCIFTHLFTFKQFYSNVEVFFYVVFILICVQQSLKLVLNKSVVDK